MNMAADRWESRRWRSSITPVLDVLQHGTRERLKEKLDWLRQFRDPLKGWSEIEQTIDVTVDFVRTQGLYRGAAKDLRKAG